MNITQLFQPERSKTCGQYCVAMITGKHIRTVIKVFGHKSGTRSKELHAAFEKLGITTLNRLTRLSSKNELPEIAVVRVTWNTKGSHWIIKNGNIIHCPWMGKFLIEDYKQFLQSKGKITSFFKIEKSSPVKEL